MPLVIKTNNASIDDVFETSIAEIRLTMDDFDIIAPLVDRTTMQKNSGLTYNEPKLSRVTAARMNEGEPHFEQTMTSSNLQVTPSLSGLKLIITKRHTEMATENLGTKIAQAQSQALGVYKDVQLATNFDLFTAELPGAGSALSFGNFRAGRARIRNGNTTGEPYKGKSIRSILHPYQYLDLLDSINNLNSGSLVTADVGVPAELVKNYNVSNIVGVSVVEDANLSVDASDDTHGSMFAMEAIRLVDFDMPELDKEIDKDTLSWIFYAHQDFGHTIYQLGWGADIYSDVTAPTV